MLETLPGEMEMLQGAIDRHQATLAETDLFTRDPARFQTAADGLAQAEVFTKEAGVTSIALSKLDGAGRGGIVFAIAQEYGLPVRFVGVGEQASDLIPFVPEAFVEALLLDRDD